MGDRMQRAKGKAEEMKGAGKRETGRATGRSDLEAEGAAEEAKGKVTNAAGKVRSGLKKATR